jgi:hypothetical protein
LHHTQVAELSPESLSQLPAAHLAMLTNDAIAALTAQQVRA